MSREPFRKNIKEFVYDARLFVKNMIVFSKSSLLLRCLLPSCHAELSWRELYKVFAVSKSCLVDAD